MREIDELFCDAYHCCRSPYEILKSSLIVGRSLQRCRSPYEIPITAPIILRHKQAKLPFSLWDSERWSVRVWDIWATVAVLLMRFIEFNDGRVEVWISMLPFSLWDSAFTKSGAIKTSYLVAVLLMRFVREFGSWKHHGQVSCRSPYEIRKRLFWWHCTNYRLPFSLWDSCYDSRTGKAEPLTFPVAVLLMRFRKCQVVLG